MSGSDICDRCAAASALLADAAGALARGDRIAEAQAQDYLAQAALAAELIGEATAAKTSLAMNEEFEKAAEVKRAIDKLQTALVAFQAAHDAFEKAQADPETTDPSSVGSKEKVAALLAELEKRKTEAAIAEDYERAASLKQRITLYTTRLEEFDAAEKEKLARQSRLDTIVAELAKMNEDKKAAAMNEDYDEAARIKDEITILQTEQEALSGGCSLSEALERARQKRVQLKEAENKSGSFIAPPPVVSAPAPVVSPKPPATSPAPASAPAPQVPAAKFQPLSLSDIPTFGPNDLQSGFLFKKGAKRRNWKERYFTLQKGTMRYFETAASSKELGNFSVNGCTCFEDTTPHSQHAKAITFAVQTSKRTFVMSSTNERDYSCWKAAIIAQGGIWDSPRSSDGSAMSAGSTGSGQLSPASKKKLDDKRRKAQYADESFRLASFRQASEGGHAPAGYSWPHTRPTPEACAASGLFFQPQAGKLDRCRCFVCPAALYSWEPADDPLAAHAAIKPNCPFVQEHRR